MSLFDNKKVNDAYSRVLATATKLCKLTGVREVAARPSDDGKPSPDFTFFTVALQESAKTTDGETVEPGFPKDLVFRYYQDTGGDENRERANTITMERTRELIIHTLGLDPATKDVIGELAARGGYTAMIGKLVGVEFQARNGKAGLQRVLGCVHRLRCRYGP